MSKTVWIRTAEIEEEVVAQRDFLTGYPINYDHKNPDKRYFQKDIVSRRFDSEEDASKKLRNEIRLISLVEVEA